MEDISIMYYGMCFNVIEEYKAQTLEAKLQTLKELGYDYVDGNVTSVAYSTDEELEGARELCRKYGFLVIRGNCLVPAAVKLTGENYDPEKVREYAKLAVSRSHAMGMKVLVLGSGGARQVPEGFDMATAEEQFVEAARIISEEAEKYGIKIALEHLNPRETNIMTSLTSDVEFVERIDHPACGVLFDYYHLDLDTDELQSIYDTGDKLYHVHYAVHDKRRYPTVADVEPEGDFFKVLKDVSYQGSVSIEAVEQPGLTFAEQAKTSMEFLQAGFEEKM